MRTSITAHGKERERRRGNGAHQDRDPHLYIIITTYKYKTFITFLPNTINKSGTKLNDSEERARKKEQFLA